MSSRDITHQQRGRRRQYRPKSQDREKAYKPKGVRRQRDIDVTPAYRCLYLLTHRRNFTKQHMEKFKTFPRVDVVGFAFMEAHDNKHPDRIGWYDLRDNTAIDYAADKLLPKSLDVADYIAGFKFKRKAQEDMFIVNLLNILKLSHLSESKLDIIVEKLYVNKSRYKQILMEIMFEIYQSSRPKRITPPTPRYNRNDDGINIQLTRLDNIMISNVTLDRLRRLYMKNITNHDEDEFMRDVIDLVYNYYPILQDKVCNCQSSISDENMLRLMEEHNIAIEMFASPFNVNLSSEAYYSIFEQDKIFSSDGNVFETSIPSGDYEVNPPFDDYILGKLHKLLEDLLSSKSFYKFVIILPNWADSVHIQALKDSRFVVDVIELESQEFTYKAGNTLSEIKQIDIGVNTLVIILSNDE
jgi:hypothetical protein